jgi:hypothetical protein
VSVAAQLSPAAQHNIQERPFLQEEKSKEVKRLNDPAGFQTQSLGRTVSRASATL